MSALKEQIGGNHYKRGMQPVELFAKLHLNPFQANVIKYISRYRYKNGIEDLRKAKHFAELAEELKPKNFTIDLENDFIVNQVRHFNNTNHIQGAESYIMYDICFCTNKYEWQAIADDIDIMIINYKDEKIKTKL